VNGKLDLVKGITKVKIEGDMGKLIKQLDGFIGFLQFLATMDIEP